MKNKFSIALSLAMIVAMLVTSLALADVVTSDVDFVATNNQTLIDLGNVGPGEVKNASTSFQLVCSGKKHADQGNTVIVQYFSAVIPSGSLTAGNATIGPIPVSWTDDTVDCPTVAPVLDDNSNSAVAITAPTTAGTYDYVVTYKVCQSNVPTECGGIDPDDTTGSIPAVTFRLTVVTNTAPSVSVTGVTDGATYEYGAVPAAGCSVTDTEDGPSSPAATLSLITGPLAAYGLGSQTATCSYTDGGGLSDSDSATYTIVDTTDPIITFVSQLPAANGNGWNNSGVTVTWICTDLVGVVSASVSESLSTEGAGQSASGTCEDTSGNTASDTVSDINIDTTAPIIADNGPTAGANGSLGWYISAVVNQFSADGAISGLADLSKASFTVSTGSAEGPAVKVNSGPVADNAGNTNTGIDSAAFMIDLSDPSVVCSSPAPTFLLNQAGAQVTASVSDAISGPASATASALANTASVGLKTVNITGYDNAGRSKTVSCSYSVTYNFGGFFQPVDNTGFNIAKAGQAIPLKWRLTDANGAPVLNLTSVTVTVTSLSCASGVTGDLVEEYAAGSSGLQNLGDGYYQFNWKTPTGYASSCKTMNLNVGDGTPHTALFQFKK